MLEEKDDKKGEYLKDGIGIREEEKRKEKKEEGMRTVKKKK